MSDNYCICASDRFMLSHKKMPFSASLFLPRTLVQHRNNNDERA